MKKTIKKNNALSTIEEHIQSLSPIKKAKFDAEYKELLLQELLIAMAKKNYTHVVRIAKELGLSTKKFQILYIEKKQNYDFEIVIKVIKQLGYTSLKAVNQKHNVSVNLSELSTKN